LAAGAVAVTTALAGLALLAGGGPRQPVHTLIGPHSPSATVVAPMWIPGPGKVLVAPPWIPGDGKAAAGFAFSAGFNFVAGPWPERGGRAAIVAPHIGMGAALVAFGGRNL
jgi:hypothetical protein